MLIRIRTSQGIKRIKIQPTESLAALKSKFHSQYPFPGKISFTKENKSISPDSANLASLNLQHGDLLILENDHPISKNPITPKISVPKDSPAPTPSKDPVASPISPRSISNQSKGSKRSKKSKKSQPPPGPSPLRSIWGADVKMVDILDPLTEEEEKALEHTTGENWAGNVHSLDAKITATKPSLHSAKENWAGTVKNLDDIRLDEKIATQKAKMIIEDVYGPGEIKLPKVKAKKLNGFGGRANSIYQFEASKLSALKIEAQEFHHVKQLRIDQLAGNKFQSILRYNKFKIQRCGHMYGTVDEGTGIVTCHAIYEPPQMNNADEALPLDDSIQFSDEEKKHYSITPSQIQEGERKLKRVEHIATLLGWKRVGFIFSRKRTGKALPLTNIEIFRLTQLQRHAGKFFVTCTAVIKNKANGAKYESFQIADQAIKLYRLNMLVKPEPIFKFDPEKVSLPMLPLENRSWGSSSSKKTRGSTGTSKSSAIKKSLRNFLGKLEVSKSVNLAETLTNSIDCSFFTKPVAIVSHSTASFTSQFPIENRPQFPQMWSDMKDRVEESFKLLTSQGLSTSEASKLKYSIAVCDFHVLIFLSQVFEVNDLDAIVPTALVQQPLLSGYIEMLKTLTGET